MPDQAAAQRLGRTVIAVTTRRRRLGIPAAALENQSPPPLRMKTRESPPRDKGHNEDGRVYFRHPLHGVNPRIRMRPAQSGRAESKPVRVEAERGWQTRQTTPAI